MSELILDIQNLIFSYKNKKSVLNIETFQLKPAEKIFLYGPSGCGKSTFLGIIAGVLNIHAGSVKVLGHEFVNGSAAMKDKIRGENMGYIFQMFNLIPYLTVLENILLPCHLNLRRMQKFSNKKELSEKAEDLCQKFNIEHLLNSKVTEISIGQQQRVAAARALLGSPKLIIADEPTSAMDADLQGVFLECLMQQCESQNSSLLFVSHDRRLAKSFHKEVSLLDINQA